MHTRPLPASALACALALFCHASFGEANPYYLGASVGVGRDSNVYRLPDETRDSWRSIGLVAGVDQPIGRQRIFGDASVRDVRYQDSSELDFVGWRLKGGLDWSTIERLSGSLTVDTARGRASYGALDNRQLRVQNLETSQRLGARARWGGQALLVLEAGYAHSRLDYSAPEYAASAVTQDAVDAGLRWQPSAALSLGVGVRRTNGDYDNIATSFSRNDVDLTARWVPTGQSSVDARLSYGKQDSDGSTSARDFKGTTGAVSWNYRPTGKLAFTTTLSRDTGLETSFLRLLNRDDPLAVGDYSRLTTALYVSGRYEATAKVHLNAALRHERRDLVDTTGAVFGQPGREGSDRLSYARLGIDYEPTRHWKLGCSVSREVRREEGGLSTPYAANLASCFGQYTIQ